MDRVHEYVQYALQNGRHALEQLESYTGVPPIVFFSVFSLLLGAYYLISGIVAPSQISGISGGAPAEESIGELSTVKLQEFDGRDPEKPLLIAVKSQIYDVSAARSFYGPGGPYSVFAGKDASRALARMSFSDRDLSGDLEGLSDQELEVLKGWEVKFSSSYSKVGRVMPVTSREEEDASAAAAAAAAPREHKAQEEQQQQLLKEERELSTSDVLQVEEAAKPGQVEESAKPVQVEEAAKPVQVEEAAKPAADEQSQSASVKPDVTTQKRDEDEDAPPQTVPEVKQQQSEAGASPSSSRPLEEDGNRLKEGLDAQAKPLQEVAAGVAGEHEEKMDAASAPSGASSTSTADVQQAAAPPRAPAAAAAAEDKDFEMVAPEAAQQDASSLSAAI